MPESRPNWLSWSPSGASSAPWTGMPSKEGCVRPIVFKNRWLQNSRTRHSRCAGCMSGKNSRQRIPSSSPPLLFLTKSIKRCRRENHEENMGSFLQMLVFHNDRVYKILSNNPFPPYWALLSIYPHLLQLWLGGHSQIRTLQRGMAYCEACALLQSMGR